MAIFGNGTEYGWTRTMGATLLEPSMGRDILADSQQNIYVVGYFMGTVDFNPTGTQDLKTSQGKEDIFITRINSDGSYGWTKAIGGSSNDWGFGLAQNTAGQLYIVGGYNSSMNFDFSGGSDYHSPKANGGIFITHFSPNGTYGWTKTFGTNYPGNSFPRAFDVAIGPEDSIYLTGYFYGPNINFAPGVSHSSKNNGSTFVTKLDLEGSHIWTDKFSGNGPYNCYDHPSAIALDNNGNIFVTGSFKGTVNFNPDGSPEPRVAVGDSDIFVLKMDASGGFVWVATLGELGFFYEGHSIKLDDLGDLLITGKLGNLGIVRLNSAGSEPIFRKVAESACQGYGVYVDSYRQIYLTGCFMGTANFDFTKEMNDIHASHSLFDIWIMKMAF